MMIRIKSVLAGAAAALLYVILSVVIVVEFPTQRNPTPVDSGGYVSNGPWIPLWPIEIGAPLIFAAVCYWTFRRISNADRPRS